MLRTLRMAAIAAAATLTAAPAMAQVNLVAHAAGAGTAGGLAATGLVEFAAEAGIANIQLKDGQTGAKYIPALGEGKIDIAGAPHHVPFLLGRAAGPFGSVGKEKGAEMAAKIQLLYPYTFSVFYMYGFSSTGISSWDDLKGKKVLQGPPKGSMPRNSQALVQLAAGLKAGEDYESVTVSMNQLANALIDGTADVAVIPGTFPGPRESQVGAAGAATAISLPKTMFESETASKLLNNVGAAPFTAPVAEIQAALGSNWTVVSEDDTFRGMSMVGGDYVNVEMDEEVAYQLTKAHIDNLDALMAKAPFMAALNFGKIDASVAGLCGKNPMVFHRGAVRAWEEAGYDVPDCAKP